MKPLVIGDKVAQLPIIQGGMGVGVSLGRLAGAVAKEGGIGIISTAQIGYQDPNFYNDQADCNRKAIREQIALARTLCEGHGLIGVNVMCALKHYKEHVQEAVKAGADLVVCGAGLPMDLPSLVEGSNTKIAPIVSTDRCTNLILRKWKKAYNRLPDLVVIEGPKAGGRLGFTKKEAISDFNYDEEIVKIITTVKETAAQNQVEIPVVIAGGIFDSIDIAHAFSLGADGVQMASRFVATYECDASDAYKEAYIHATEADVKITQSPVGMPGRALNNAFLERITTGKEPIQKCYQCLAKCNPAEIPYCITQALINAVKGDLDNGLIFCGANIGRINKIVSVHELMEELFSEFCQKDADCTSCNQTHCDEPTTKPA